MTEIIGVRFKDVGKIYYFSPNKNTVKCGSHVIVETARGVECGEVVIANREIEDSKIFQELKHLVKFQELMALGTPQEIYDWLYK